MKIETQMRLKNSSTAEVFGVYLTNRNTSGALTSGGKGFPETHEDAATLATARVNCCVARTILRKRASANPNRPHQHLAGPKLRDRLKAGRREAF